MLLANEQPVEPSNLRQYIIDFIENSNLDPNLPVSPDQAIIALKPGNNTPMSVFNETLGEILAAYDDLRDEASMNRCRNIIALGLVNVFVYETSWQDPETANQHI